MQGVQQQIGQIPKCNLVEKNQGYALECSKHFFVLTSGDLSDLYYSYADEGLEISANNQVFRPGDALSFSLYSDKRGFASLFVVEEDGKVGILELNLPIDNRIDFPESDAAYEVINNTGRTLSEFYVAIVSPDKLAQGNFERIGSHLLDETAFKLDRLVDLMRRYPVATIRTKILAVHSPD
jgi:hypothetical protein